MEQRNLFGFQCNIQIVISYRNQCCKSLSFLRINTNVKY